MKITECFKGEAAASVAHGSTEKVILKIYETEYVFRVLWNVTLFLIELDRLEGRDMRENRAKKEIWSRKFAGYRPDGK